LINDSFEIGGKNSFHYAIDVKEKNEIYTLVYGGTYDIKEKKLSTIK
jgi:hypothetical protein